jgi:hypothetical protein
VASCGIVARAAVFCSAPRAASPCERSKRAYSTPALFPRLRHAVCNPIHVIGALSRAIACVLAWLPLRSQAPPACLSASCLAARHMVHPILTTRNQRTTATDSLSGDSRVASCHFILYRGWVIRRAAALIFHTGATALRRRSIGPALEASYEMPLPLFQSNFMFMTRYDPSPRGIVGGAAGSECRPAVGSHLQPPLPSTAPAVSPLPAASRMWAKLFSQRLDCSNGFKLLWRVYAVH